MIFSRKWKYKETVFSIEIISLLNRKKIQQSQPLKVLDMPALTLRM